MAVWAANNYDVQDWTQQNRNIANTNKPWNITSDHGNYLRWFKLRDLTNHRIPHPDWVARGDPLIKQCLVFQHFETMASQRAESSPQFHFKKIPVLQSQCLFIWFFGSSPFPDPKTQCSSTKHMVSKYRNFLKPQNTCQSKWTSTNKKMPAPNILSQHWFIAHIHNNSFVFPYRNVHVPSPKHGPPMVVHQTYSSFAIDAFIVHLQNPKQMISFYPRLGMLNMSILYDISLSLSISITHQYITPRSVF